MKKVKLTLEEHHQILYEIVYVIDDFCKKYGIDYILHAGSMLGAVRHNAIIPWDDDVDIVMTRPNYERFVKLYRENQPQGYPIFDFDHFDWYDYPFAKIAKDGTFFRQGYFNQPPMGIFVDVFVVDGCGNNLKEAQQHFINVSVPVLEKQFWFNGNPKVNFNNWKSKIIYYLQVFPFIIFTPIKKWYLRQLYKKAQEYSVADSKYSAVIVCGLEGLRDVMPTECFTHITKRKFGAREMPISELYDEYLSAMYGDYMTPLPPEKRTHHGEGVSYLLVDE